VILLPQLQECNDHPCDCGSSRADLEANPEYAGLDFSTLTDDWTSKQGFYASDVKTLQARARWNRRWLRERPEKSIVLVAHGDCLRYLTEGESTHVSSYVVPRLNETGHNSHALWANTEVREYTFASDDDEEAALVLVRKIAQEGADDPTSSSRKFTY
jgi:broad specificity phosphatase PhoE